MSRNRNEKGQFCSATSTDDADEDACAGIFETFAGVLGSLAVKKGTRRFAAASVVAASAALGHYAQSLPKALQSMTGWPPGRTEAAQDGEVPDKFVITTFDKSEGDPSRKLQHKLVKLEKAVGNKREGTYEYTDWWMHGSHGDVTLQATANGSFELQFHQAGAQPMGYGWVMVRPFYRNGEPVVWLGTEVGHDCICAGDIKREGPLSSVPAIVSETDHISAAIERTMWDKPSIELDYFLKAKDLEGVH